MNHPITTTSVLAPLRPACTALAQALGQTTPGDKFKIDATVFHSHPFAWDMSEPRHAAHRPAFDAIVAENAPPTSLPSQVYTP